MNGKKKLLLDEFTERDELKKNTEKHKEMSSKEDSEVGFKYELDKMIEIRKK